MDDCAYSKRIAESYRLLEAPFGASHEELKQAYRDLARIRHPDRFAQNDRLREKAEKRFAEISTAYNFLIQVSAAEATPKTATADIQATVCNALERAAEGHSLLPQSASGGAWLRTSAQPYGC